nr:MAG TPA: hypothetical protein [Caudoviricetes sp.]
MLAVCVCERCPSVPEKGRPPVAVIPFQKPITVRSNCEPGTIRESSVGSDGKHCCGGEWPKRFISFPLKSCASQDAAASLSTAASKEGRARCKSGGCRQDQTTGLTGA